MNWHRSVLILALGLAFGPVLHAAGLNPTRGSMDRQLAGAEASGYQRALTVQEVHDAVRSGELRRLRGNEDYEIKEMVELPYARAEVRHFIEELAAGYRAACGERLVVTSLVRPKSRQPRNSHPRSAHALGLAMDLRRSWKRGCRGWLEANLLQLENGGVLEATRERHPPHYHVVLFTEPYVEHLARLEIEASRFVSKGGNSMQPREVRYVVQRGDTLWRIAQRHGVELSTLRDFNSLRGSTIRPGQLLRVPSVSGTATGTLR